MAEMQLFLQDFMVFPCPVPTVHLQCRDKLLDIYISNVQDKGHIFKASRILRVKEKPWKTAQNKTSA